MAWIEEYSPSRAGAKHAVSVDLRNKLSTLLGIADDINLIIEQIIFVSGDSPSGTEKGWLRNCETARNTNILGGGGAKECLERACSLVNDLADTEWVWVDDG